MSYRNYTLFWEVDKQEQSLETEDHGEAVSKAEEIASKGYNVYLAHYNEDGEETYYETFN